jgi:hypothetical protein
LIIFFDLIGLFLSIAVCFDCNLCFDSLLCPDLHACFSRCSRCHFYFPFHGYSCLGFDFAFDDRLRLRISVCCYGHFSAVNWSGRVTVIRQNDKKKCSWWTFTVWENQTRTAYRLEDGSIGSCLLLQSTWFVCSDPVLTTALSETISWSVFLPVLFHVHRRFAGEGRGL